MTIQYSQTSDTTMGYVNLEVMKHIDGIFQIVSYQRIREQDIAHALDTAKGEYPGLQDGFKLFFVPSNKYPKILLFYANEHTLYSIYFCTCWFMV